MISSTVILVQKISQKSQKIINFEKIKKMPGYIILLYIHVYHKQRSYAICFLKYKARQTEFFVICDYILPFDPLDNPENKNFEKLKPTPGDSINLHICTKKDNHMMYGSFDMEHYRQNFLSFWTIFCHFKPYGPTKSKF